MTCLHDLFKIYQVSKEKVSTALSYDFTLLFSLTELGVEGCHEQQLSSQLFSPITAVQSASFSNYENESTITCGKNDDLVLSLRDKLLKTLFMTVLLVIMNENQTSTNFML